MEPAKLLLLYIYQSDATQAINRVLPASERPSFPEMRKKAARIYLDGLKESEKYNIPEQKPELPVGEEFERPFGNGPDDEEYKRKLAELAKKDQENRAKLRQARHDQALWENRRILNDQIAWLYLSKPSAETEIRELATEVLQNDAMVATVLKGVKDEEKVALLEASRAPPRHKQPTKPPPAAPRWRIWVLLGFNVLLLILLVVYWIWRRYRGQ